MLLVLSLLLSVVFVEVDGDPRLEKKFADDEEEPFFSSAIKALEYGEGEVDSVFLGEIDTEMELLLLEGLFLLLLVVESVDCCCCCCCCIL